MKDDTDTSVQIVTAYGMIDVDIYSRVAPFSARAFLKFVDDRAFEKSGGFYRSVRSADNDRGRPRIDVLEGGLQHSGRLFSSIPHESTRVTGLRHIDGAISLGRDEINTATGAEFFLCVGDQPGLDFGGERNADRQGFAVFGRVRRGMDVVRAIHVSPTSPTIGTNYTRGQLFDPLIRFLEVRRLRN